ncbi:MAG: helix-turn-helix transcriptional regulator [Spirochaetes bacterium]|nr:helix-turn-helix transcriptional regulator [Spirochaetota bacterium]
MMQIGNMIFWNRIVNTLLVFTLMLLMHFYIRISDLYKNKENDIFIYIPAIFIALFYNIQENPLSIIIYRHKGIAVTKNTGNSLYLYFYKSYFVLSVILLIIILIFWYYKTLKNREKRIAILQFVNVVFVCAVFFVINFTTNRYCSFHLPFACALALSVYGVLTSIVLHCHQFRKFDNKNYFKTVFDNVSDFIFFLDSSNYVIRHSANIHALLKVSDKALCFMNLLDIEGTNKYEEFLAGDNQIYNTNLNIKFSKKMIIPTNCYLSRVYDVYNDFVGVLVVAIEEYDSKYLQQRYQLTERHMEIIEFIQNEDLSSKQIGEKLLISGRTVEWHLKTIYTKFGVKTRLELLNILSEYLIK